MIQPRIRVLIADDSALQRAHLSQLINEQLDMELVGSAASGQDAVRRSSETQPDVVLMDIHMPDMDGIQATWLVSAQLPNGAVIMVTSEERIDFLQKAMSAGAQGYVLKPFGNGEELLRTVRDAYRRMQSRRVSMTDMPAPPPMSLMLGKRIAVIGTKGGVGTTTVATHLALALRRTTQESVIVFDSDLQYGDAALHLALTSKHSIVDLVQRVDALDSATLSRVTTAHPTGVALLDRPPQPELAETLNCNHLRSVMTALARSYDWTVVDTARFYDDKTLAVLDQADIQVIVLTASLGSLRNARQYLGLSERLGYPKDRMCFVLNRANSTGGLSIDDITRVLGTRELIRLPSGGAQLTQAINDGRQALSNQFSSAFDQLVTMVRRLAADVAPSARR